MATKDPTRVMTGRMGGLAKSARYNPNELTAAATAGFHAKFVREVDPDGLLPEEERARRAAAARKAHMTRLALRSAAARRKA